MQLPTVKVAGGPRGYKVINKDDFDPEVHQPWPPPEDAAIMAEPEPEPVPREQPEPEPTAEETAQAAEAQPVEAVRIEFDARKTADMNSPAVAAWAKAATTLAAVAAVLDVEQSKRRPRRGAVKALEQRLEELAGEE